MRKTILTIISMLIISSAFIYSQDDNPKSYQEKIRSGDYYPYHKLTDEDNLQYPIDFQMKAELLDLRDLKNSSDYFYTKFYYEVYSKYDSLYVAENGTEISIVNEVPNIIFPESDTAYYQWFYDGKIYLTEEGLEYSSNDKLYQEIENHYDSLYSYSGYFEGVLPHKWDLRNYPFDKQNIKVEFSSLQDTSFVSLSQASHVSNKLSESYDYLLDGFEVVDITSSKKYIKRPAESNSFADGYRARVDSALIFNIGLERKGSYLYYKLFFGAFLSYIISLLVFFIDKKLFETRITLSLGAIFGAVGNKYFVENTMPSIQVLTKADIINNLIIIFIIINIFIVIAQSTKKINLGVFENSKYSIILSLSTFVLLNLLIIIL